ncbi:MAG: hypothetical protein DRO99_01105 [Candidatus Aenigmatarchaeota archaeon]|nr:MAG: hypothetical protein DRO99_01105 [Candidatus Aenigmarchaeota archaeon]
MAKRKPAKKNATKKTKTSKASRKKPSRKPRKRARPKRWQDRTEKEWEAWGKDLGKRIEKHGSRAERVAKRWWYRTFGPIGPLLESIIGIFFMGLATLIMGWLNYVLLSVFVSKVVMFLQIHLGIFFLMMLLLNYSKYFRIAVPKTEWILRPVETAAGISVILWVISWAVVMSPTYPSISVIQALASHILTNVIGIFFALLVLAYFIALIIRIGIVNGGGAR